MIIEIPDLTYDECGDIAITAAEGGIGYWAQMKEYKPSRWADGAITDPDFVYYTIAPLLPDETGWDWDHPIDITPTLIRRGFEAGLAADPDKGGWMFKQLIQYDRRDWTGDMDSAMAESVIQFAVYGRLEWG